MSTLEPRSRRPVAFALLRRAEHVLFVGLLLLGAAQSVADGTHAWPAALGAAVLLAWYALGMLLARRPADPAQRRQDVALWLAGLCAGWLALVALSPDFVWLVFAIFFLCLQAVALRWSIPAVGLLTLVAILAVALHRRQLDLGAVIGPFTGAAVAIVITVVYRDLQQEARRRDRLMAELSSAQTRLAAAERHAGTLAERERLAHDIHDTVAQGLSGILLLLRSARTSALDDGARQQIDAAVLAASTALEDTRRMVRALAPVGLAGQSLTTALQRLIDDAATVGIDLGLTIDGQPHELPTRTAVALLRTAQGALGNVIAHSQATHAQLTLTYQADQVSLDVADDGLGFDLQSAPRASNNGTGIGLASLRTRLTEVDGTLTVESTPGSGTALSATIPVQAADA